MKICIAASEALPFVKTGGLSDVCYALSSALAAEGHEVILVLPRYYRIDITKIKCKRLPEPLCVPLGHGECWGAVYHSEEIKGVSSYLIEHEGFFGRDGLYDDGYNAFSDNAVRFTFFNRAVLQLCHLLNFSPDIIHCNDWQTALIPIFLKTIYRNSPILKKTKSVMTIHNIGFQGIFDKNEIISTQLGWEYFNEDALKYYDNLNFLKGGILWADAVSTVSKKYAQEIQTHEFGFDLAGVVQRKKDVLYGITNGVDYSQWDPETDNKITANYSKNDMAGKAICKLHLQKELGLQCDASIPLISTVTRVTHQKGIDILAAALKDLHESENFQYVILGTGDEGILWQLNSLAYNFPGRFSVIRKFDNELAHRIEAGSDMYAMPSRYEPCGLNQMYSLRFGTIPIVRATGGLDDTISEWDDVSRDGTGFKFSGYSAESLEDEIRKAIRLFNSKDSWSKIVHNAMSFHLGWENVVKDYEQMYNLLLN